MWAAGNRYSTGHIVRHVGGTSLCIKEHVASASSNPHNGLEKVTHWTAVAEELLIPWSNIQLWENFESPPGTPTPQYRVVTEFGCDFMELRGCFRGKENFHPKFYWAHVTFPAPKGRLTLPYVVEGDSGIPKGRGGSWHMYFVGKKGRSVKVDS